MSVTIGYRSLVAFGAGVAACVIVLLMFQAMSADAAPGDADATFVAMTPCRVIDTRANPTFHIGPHATFGAADTETIQARGTNGDCVIPADAVGLSLNVTALNATAPSFLTIWPDGERPRAASLNPAPGQPPVPNAVATNLSSTGSFRIFNNAGSVDVVVDVNGFYTSASLRGLDQRLAALETAVAALESKTAAISVEDAGSTVRFTGVNVQIVDGSGDTGCSDLGQFLEDCNGFGNLIVGYNEDFNGVRVRSGSHNIVTGNDNDYTRYGGIIAGQSNIASGEYATITGGRQNSASGLYSSVSGGEGNTANGRFSSVSGGRDNTASGFHSSASGGQNNTASGGNASASGGRSNTASGEFSSVSGGQSNTAGSLVTSVSGGNLNLASNFASAVSGGQLNAASGLTASVAGGEGGEASGDYAVVVGGSVNLASGPRAVVVGGGQNIAAGSKAVVSGGSQRSSTDTFDWRAGTLFETQ